MRRAALTFCLAALVTACGRSDTSQPAPAAASPASTAPATSPAPPPRPAVDPATTITPEGLGGVRIGMTQEDAVRVLGGRWRVGEPLEDTPGACRHIFDGENEGVGAVHYMVLDGRVARISISNTDGRSTSDVRSDRGVGLGATEDDVRRAYGDALQSEGHRYLGPNARYLTLWTANPPAADAVTEDPAARGIRFVTGDDRRVQEIIAGGPAIQYVEGCA